MKIFFHPLFFVAIVVALVGGWGLFVLCAVVAVLVHETSHAMAANYYGIKTKRLTLLPFGAQVNIECEFLPRKSRTVILLAGAMGNIVAAMMASSLLWFWPTWYPVLEMLIAANCMVALLNLLPLYPFDGGKILNTPKWLSVLVFGCLFFVFTFAWFNVAMMIMAIFMLFTVFVDIKTEFKDTILVYGKENQQSRPRV